MEVLRGETMNTPLSNAQMAEKCLENSKNQIELYKQWLLSLVATLDQPLSAEIRDVVDSLMFWQEAKANWERSVEYWAAREAVYPPPNGG